MLISIVQSTKKVLTECQLCTMSLWDGAGFIIFPPMMAEARVKGGLGQGVEIEMTNRSLQNHQRATKEASCFPSLLPRVPAEALPPLLPDHEYAFVKR